MDMTYAMRAIYVRHFMFQLGQQKTLERREYILKLFLNRFLWRPYLFHFVSASVVKTRVLPHEYQLLMCLCNIILVFLQ